MCKFLISFASIIFIAFVFAFPFVGQILTMSVANQFRYKLGNYTDDIGVLTVCFCNFIIYNFDDFIL